MRHTHGSIEVVCGSMFSGKTDELIRRLVRATIAKQKVQVFKPAIDIRYAAEKVASHTGSTFEAIPVEKAADIRAKLDKDTTVVGIAKPNFDPEIGMLRRNCFARHARIAGWIWISMIIWSASAMSGNEHVSSIQYAWSR
jgi:thymidine kinase